MTFNEFAKLTFELTTITNQDQVNSLKNELVSIPAVDWSMKMSDAESGSSALQGTSGDASDFLNQLQRIYFALPSKFVKSITGTVSSAIHSLISRVQLKPNNLQLAVGSYAVGLLAKKPRQIW